MYQRPSSKTDFSMCPSFASSGRMSTSRAAAPSSPVPARCTEARSRCRTSDPARRSWSPPSAPTGRPCSTTSITSTVVTRKSWASSRAWARISPASRAKVTSATIFPGLSGIESTVLSKKIGIDLGTSTILVYVKGEGVVVNEPAVMATDEKGARVLAVGRAAAEMVGRGRKARAVRLVRDGNGVDYNLAGAMLQHLIGRIVGRQRIFRPDVMLSVAAMVTGVERRAVLEATIQAGAKTAYLIDKPMAAAIGARLPVATTDGIAIVNLGAGSTELAVIAHGETLAIESLRIGGDAFDRAIDAAIGKARGVRLMPGEAERLKIQLGSASGPVPDADLEVSAVDEEGARSALRVSGHEVRAAIQELLDAIAASLQRVVAQVPEARRAAVLRSGAVLTGGGAQLRGIAEFLALRAGVPTRVAPEPQSCVAIGTGMALDNLQVIRRGQHYIT